jgi:hypothetical protein
MGHPGRPPGIRKSKGETGYHQGGKRNHQKKMPQNLDGDKSYSQSTFGFLIPVSYMFDHHDKIVGDHSADHHENKGNIQKSHPIDPDIFLAGGYYVYRSLSKIGTSSFVTLPARVRQVGFVYAGQRIVCPSDVMAGMTAYTAGGIRISGSASHSVIGIQICGYPFRNQSIFFDNPF